jgi:hypothetical protein
MAARPPVAPESHHQLLYAAIDDIGESVRGNDAKAYAALVLHGLILTAITTLVTHLGGIYQRSTCVEQVLGLSSLAVVLACFLVSAWLLIDAITPYRPEKLEERIKRHYEHVFFPTDIFQAFDPHACMTKRLSGMDPLKVRDELVAETLKLGDILRHESNQTKLGYYWLRYELVAAVGFLLVVSVAAL